MKLEWISDEDIGVYDCIITDDDGHREKIHMWDYTCEYHRNRKAKDVVYSRYHPNAYEVSYCSGYSMRETFDDSYTLEDIKIWCEDYLLDKYINRYNNIVANLERIKSESEWAIQFKNGRLNAV
jgi:DUF971 family protein